MPGGVEPAERLLGLVDLDHGDAGVGEGVGRAAEDPLRVAELGLLGGQRLRSSPTPSSRCRFQKPLRSVTKWRTESGLQSGCQIDSAVPPATRSGERDRAAVRRSARRPRARSRPTASAGGSTAARRSACRPGSGAGWRRSRGRCAAASTRRSRGRRRRAGSITSPSLWTSRTQIRCEPSGERRPSAKRTPLGSCGSGVIGSGSPVGPSSPMPTRQRRWSAKLEKAMPPGMKLHDPPPYSCTRVRALNGGAITSRRVPSAARWTIAVRPSSSGRDSFQTMPPPAPPDRRGRRPGRRHGRRRRRSARRSAVRARSRRGRSASSPPAYAATDSAADDAEAEALGLARAAAVRERADAERVAAAVGAQARPASGSGSSLRRRAGTRSRDAEPFGLAMKRKRTFAVRLPVRTLLGRASR